MQKQVNGKSGGQGDPCDLLIQHVVSGFGGLHGVFEISHSRLYEELGHSHITRYI